MAWIRAGTVTVTNGSSAIVGSGTTWLTTVNPGDTFYGPDRELYEVGAVATDTGATLVTPYLGSSVSGGSYAVFPTQDAVRIAANRLGEVLQALQLTTMSLAGPTSNNDRLLINQAGVSRAITLQTLQALLGGGGSGTIDLAALPAVTLPLNNSDLLLVAQGSNAKVTVAQLREALGGIAGLLLEVNTGDSAVASNNFTVRAKTANTATLTNQAPTGSATTAEQRFFGGSNVDNAPYLRVRATASVVDLTSLATGSAVAQELRLGVGSSTQVRMTNTGGLTFRAPASASVANNEHSLNPIASDRMRVSYRDNVGVLRQADLQLLEPGQTWYVSQDERAVFFIGGKDGSDQGENLRNATYYADLLGVPLILPPWKIRVRKSFKCNKIIGARGLSWIVAEAPYPAEGPPPFVFADGFIITNRNFSQGYFPATAEDVYYLDFGLQIEVERAGIGIAGTKRSHFAGLQLFAKRVPVAPDNALACNALIDLYACNRNSVIEDCDFDNRTGAYKVNRFHPDGGGCLWVRQFADGLVSQVEANASENIQVFNNRFLHMTSDECIAVYSVTGILRQVSVFNNKIYGTETINGVHQGALVTVLSLGFNVPGLDNLNLLGTKAACYHVAVHDNYIEARAAVYEVLRFGGGLSLNLEFHDIQSYNNTVRWVRSNDPVTGPKAVWNSLPPATRGLDPDIASIAIRAISGNFGTAFVRSVPALSSNNDKVISDGAATVNAGFSGWDKVLNPEAYGNLYLGAVSCKAIIGGRVEGAGFCFYNVRLAIGVNFRQTIPAGGAVFYVNEDLGGIYGMKDCFGESYSSLVALQGGTIPATVTLINNDCTMSVLPGGLGAVQVPTLVNESSNRTLVARNNTTVGANLAISSGAGLVNRQSNSWNGVRDDPPVMSGGNAYIGAQTVATSLIGSAAVLITDAAAANTFRVTLDQNSTLANPTNMRDGGHYEWRIQQGPGGGFTLGYGNKFKFPSGVWPTLSTAPNAVDWLRGRYHAAGDVIECSIEKDYR